MFEEIKAKAQAEIDAIKADTRSVEERFDDMFKLGAMHVELARVKQKLMADMADAEEKIRAEFGLPIKS